VNYLLEGRVSPAKKRRIIPMRPGGEQLQQSPLERGEKELSRNVNLIEGTEARVVQDKKGKRTKTSCGRTKGFLKR